MDETTRALLTSALAEQGVELADLSIEELTALTTKIARAMSGDDDAPAARDDAYNDGGDGTEVSGVRTYLSGGIDEEDGGDDGSGSGGDAHDADAAAAAAAASEFAGTEEDSYLLGAGDAEHAVESAPLADYPSGFDSAPTAAAAPPFAASLAARGGHAQAGLSRQPPPPPPLQQPPSVDANDEDGYVLVLLSSIQANAAAVADAETELQAAAAERCVRSLRASRAHPLAR